MSEFARAAALVIAVAHLLLELWLGPPQSSVWCWTVIGAVSLRLLLDGEGASLAFTSGIALFFIFVVPCAGFVARGEFGAVWFLAFTFLTLELVRSLRLAYPQVALHRECSRWSVIALLMCLAIALIAPALVEASLGRIVFIAPFALSLIFFEQVLRSRPLVLGVLLLGVYAVVIAVYVAFFWSGFGRLVIASFVLMPVLLAVRYLRLPVFIWQAMAISPPIMALSHLSRYGEVGNPGAWTQGSAGHHIELSMMLARTDVSDFLGGLERWFSQLILMLLNWFPRELWPNKPVGIGASSVDDWIGREGYGDGYSVSLGFVGEQLYLLGDFFLLGVFASLLVLLACRVLIVRLSGAFYAPVVAFDVNLISFLWGGNATFGSRAWFFVGPMLCLVFVMGRIAASNGDRASGRRFAFR